MQPRGAGWQAIRSAQAPVRFSCAECTCFQLHCAGHGHHNFSLLLLNARAGHATVCQPVLHCLARYSCSRRLSTSPPARQQQPWTSQTHVMAGVGFFIAYTVGVRPAACAAASSLVVA